MRKQTALMTTALLLSNTLYANSTVGFNWDIVSSEMGLELDDETFKQMQREMTLGRHPYEIYVNDKYIGDTTVDISESDVDPDSLVVALPARMFHKMPLKRSALDDLFDLSPETYVKDLTTYIPGSSVILDDTVQAVNISIPQIYTDNRRRSFMSPRLWNYGVPAFRLNYNADVTHIKEAGLQETNAYFSSEAQLNLGRWRLSGRSNLTKTQEEGWLFDGYERHASTLIPDLGAMLKLGEFTTVSKYLPGIPVIGINLFEDSNQVDPLDSEYKPVIAGFANSAALVVIRQGMHILRQADVPAGPFEFNDINVIGNSGDIEVEIKEYSGQVTSFIVPYALSDKLLKADRFSWSSALGRYDDGTTSDHPWLGQFSAGYGMPGGRWTLYGGLTQSENFGQYIVGSAVDVGALGAMSLQWENTRMTTEDRRKGNVVELSWSKYFELSESNFEFSYRHTMNGQLGSISEALAGVSGREGMPDLAENEFVKDEASLSLTKVMGNWGSLSGNAVWSRTNLGNESRTLSGNWFFPIRGMTGSIQVQHSKDDVANSVGHDDWAVSLRLDIPLNMFDPFTGAYSRMSLSTVRMNESRYSNQIEFSTDFGSSSRWDMSVAAQQTSQSSDSFDAILNYHGEHTSVGINASHTGDQSRFTGRMAGGVLVTSSGIFFSEYLFGNVAVVHVPDGQTVKLKDSDQSGEWMVLTGLPDFVENTVRLDPDSLPPNLNVLNGYQSDIIPADGAVIPVEFETFLGVQSAFHIVMEDGTPLTYGALVTVEDMPIEMDPAVTDELGVAYFPAVPRKGKLTARWRADGEVMSCHADYELEGNLDSAFDIYEQTIECR